MKKFFYGVFTDIAIVNCIKAYCWIIGIRKGRRLIIYHSGYTNKDGGGIVAWSEIKSFNWDWVNYTTLSFNIGIHLYNHDEKFANELGLQNTYIEKDSYTWGCYKIKDVVNYFKAQAILRENFSDLFIPPRQ